MLSDSRSESLVTNFAAQWLFLRDVVAKQPFDVLQFRFRRWPAPASSGNGAVRLEHLRENRSVLDLLNANYTFINDRLAKHYGIPNIEGTYSGDTRFRRAASRGGLLGKGAS
jgi:hypothetical protein